MTVKNRGDEEGRGEKYDMSRLSQTERAKQWLLDRVFRCPVWCREFCLRVYY